MESAVLEISKLQSHGGQNLQARSGREGIEVGGIFTRSDGVVAGPDGEEAGFMDLPEVWVLVSEGRLVEENVEQEVYEIGYWGVAGRLEEEEGGGLGFGVGGCIGADCDAGGGKDVGEKRAEGRLDGGYHGKVVVGGGDGGFVGSMVRGLWRTIRSRLGWTLQRSSHPDLQTA